jgi:hypothetical protein
LQLLFRMSHERDHQDLFELRWPFDRRISNREHCLSGKKQRSEPRPERGKLMVTIAIL